MDTKSKNEEYAVQFLNDIYRSGIFDFKPKSMPKNLSEIGVLFTLKTRQGQMTSGEIASCLSLKTARVAAILKALEEKELITRIQKKEDRRIILVSLTKKGCDICLNEITLIKNKLVHAYELLGFEEMENFKNTLIKLCEIGMEESAHA